MSYGEYKFDTKDASGEVVDTIIVKYCNGIQEAREYAKKVIANSRNNEVSHGRITKIG